MSGPLPKHPSTRSSARSKTGFATLPSAGRKGSVPEWPLMPDPEMTASLELAQDRIAGLEADMASVEDGREKGRIRRDLNKLQLQAAVLGLKVEQAADLEIVLWTALWSTPQAVAWEQSYSFARILASWTRWQVRGEQGDLKAATEARQIAKEYGLTPLSLQKMRQEIEHADAAEERGKRRRGVPVKRPRDDGGDPRSVLSVVS